MTSWCPLPWISSDMRNNGDLRICTHAHHGTDNGLLRRDDGRFYNAGVDSIDLSRNSSLLKSVRSAMMRGEWHPACARCRHEHNAGMVSRNSLETDLWAERFSKTDAESSTDDDGTIDVSSVPVMHYGIRFGNKCNLKCRMCNPTESSYWYDDYVKLWGTNTYDDSFGKVTLMEDAHGRLRPDTEQYDWYESESFWKQLEDNARNIVHVHTVGGEPTLIDRQYDFLERCIDLGISGNLIVEYNSNITAIPSRAWDLWPHFKEIRIGASIDGIGTVNDYIRHPSRWERIEQNLRAMDEHNGINFVIWIAATVQIYNIYYLPEMMIWMLRQGFKRIGWDPASPLIRFHPLYGPKFLSTRVLPHAAKMAISNRFDAMVGEMNDIASSILSSDRAKRDMVIAGMSSHLDTYRSFMLMEDHSHLMPKFLSFTERLDLMRGERMEHSLPELHGLIMESGVK